MGGTIAQHVYFKTFLSCFPQNKTVKSPKFAWSDNGKPDGKFFKFPFGTQAAHICCARVEVWCRRRW